MPGPTHQVANPPSKTLLVYDGDCRFCKLWIARWREITTGAVDYEELQDAAVRFPEVPRAAFEQAIKLIETDGRVFSGAEAVYRSLGRGGGSGFGRWSFEHVPGFAPVSNFAYAFIARHRELAHTVTSLFWGEDVRRPTYFHARRWFLRFLGVIYLIAFLSLWVQVDGLIGARGLMPVPQLLTEAHAQLGSRAYLALPTLCWFSSSNAFLHFLCGAGAILSALLVAGIAPILSLVLLFASYLSLSIVGQTFFSFQWDVLLLETGFLAIFLAPWRWWPRRGQLAPPSRAALFLLHFLLFKLMLMSGVVKLRVATRRGPISLRSIITIGRNRCRRWSGGGLDKSPEWFKHFLDRFRPRRGNRGRLSPLAAAPAALAWLRRARPSADRDWRSPAITPSSISSPSPFACS